MKETMKKILKHRSLQCFAALGMIATSAIASACTTVVKDNQGNVLFLFDHTETYINAALELGDLALNKAPRAAAHLAREAAPIINAAGGIYATKRHYDAQEDWHDVIRENNAKYWSHQNRSLKTTQQNGHQGQKQGWVKVPTNQKGSTTGRTVVVQRSTVIQYQ